MEMKNIGKYITIVALVTLVAGLLGSVVTKELVRNNTPSADSADAGMARDMSVHHQQAVEMSFTALEQSSDPEVRRMAYDIINTQANQRGMMLGWLNIWDLPATSTEPPMSWMKDSSAKNMADMQMPGNDSQPNTPMDESSTMPGMATPEEMNRLKNLSGKEADILYLQLMIRHHTGGIAMAEAALSDAKQPVIRQLAQKIVDGQQSEITAMQSMLDKRQAAQ
jgi:uncharacterized protein (DUF305 family)